MAQLIKFRLDAPDDKGTPHEVAVAVAHILKIEPAYYQRDEAGQLRPITRQAQWETLALERSFLVHDVLGDVYDSRTASAAGQRLLEDLWQAAT